jgi:hypothetical protein
MELDPNGDRETVASTDRYPLAYQFFGPSDPLEAVAAARAEIEGTAASAAAVPAPPDVTFTSKPQLARQGAKLDWRGFSEDPAKLVRDRSVLADAGARDRQLGVFSLQEDELPPWTVRLGATIMYNATHWQPLDTAAEKRSYIQKKYPIGVASMYKDQPDVDKLSPEQRGTIAAWAEGG